MSTSHLLSIYFISFSSIFVLQASLNAGLDLRKAVELPPNEDLNEWIAVHGMVCGRFDERNY